MTKIKTLLILMFFTLIGCKGSDNNIDEKNIEPSNVDDAIFNLLAIDLYNQIDSFWDGKEGWLGYKDNVDISHQEAIHYLSFIQEKYGVGDYEKIKKSIAYSISYLQSDSGAFYQESVESYVRTSLYVIGILKALKIYPKLELDVYNLTEKVKLAASWLSSKEKEWAGNHQIFALIAFTLLHEHYEDSIYLADIERVKYELINDFVHFDDSNGYWPEAPKNWPNRLLTPYLQTQIIGMGYYLEINNDEELKSLFIKELRFFNDHFDKNTLTIDITDSYSYAHQYKPMSITSIPIGAPAVLAYSCKYTARYCNFITDSGELSELYGLMSDNFEKDGYLTLFTDSFYRFGVIKDILEVGDFPH